MRVIAKYTKTGAARYVSHLDLLRSMQRNFRRANIPIKYSQGFNPHQIIAFATASSVGIGSVGEWIDLKLEDGIDKDVILSSINDQGVEGIKFMEIHQVPEEYPALMKIVSAADYCIDIYTQKEYSFQEIDKRIEETKNNELFAEKKSKRGIETVDISKFIIEMRRLDDQDAIIELLPEVEEEPSFRLFCKLKHEPDGALNPNVLIPALLKSWDILQEKYIAYRLNIWAKKDGEQVPIWSL